MLSQIVLVQQLLLHGAEIGIQHSTPSVRLGMACHMTRATGRLGMYNIRRSPAYTVHPL